MAEVVAAAASVAGLASLAIQLTESVATLRRFYRSVRNASETLEELVAELETIALALAQVERNHLRGETLESTDLLERCVKSCERGARRLQSVIDKTRTLQNRAKKLGQLYVAIKETDEQTILSDLERAKSSLAFAFQIYSQARQEAQFERLSHQLTSVPKDVVLHLHSSTHILQTATNDHARVLEATDGGDSQNYEMVNHNHRSWKQKRKGFQLRIPTPFFQRIWQVALAQSMGGWDFHIQTFSIRPVEAPIFTALKDRDLLEMRKLFASGAASPYDSWPNGTTLLAAESNAVEILRYLLTHFRFSNIDKVAHRAASVRRFGPFHRRVDPFKRPLSDGSNTCKVEVFKAYMSQGSFDPFDCFGPDADYGYYNGIFGFSSSGCVDALLQNLPIPLASLPFQSRFECAVHMNSRETTPTEFLRVCGISGVTTQLATAQTWMDITALHMAVDAISDRWPDGEGLEAWSELATCLIRQGANMHVARCRAIATPLIQTLAGHHGVLCFKTALEKIRYWLRLVQAAGVNLWDYGATESALLECLRDRWYKELTIGRGHSLCGIRYGPEPADWSLCVRSVSEMPFYKQIIMPGAWIDGRVPDVIAWPREMEQISSVAWRVWDRGFAWGSEYGRSDLQVIFGPPREIEDLIRDDTLSAFEQVMFGVQDDHGVVNLLRMRTHSRDRAPRRSSSQPPPIHRKMRAYCMPGRLNPTVKSSDIFGEPDYHLCPADGLHRFGCRIKVCKGQLFNHHDSQRFDLADCLRF